MTFITLRIINSRESKLWYEAARFHIKLWKCMIHQFYAKGRVFWCTRFISARVCFLPLSLDQKLINETRKIQTNLGCLENLQKHWLHYFKSKFNISLICLAQFTEVNRITDVVHSIFWGKFDIDIPLYRKLHTSCPICSSLTNVTVSFF